MTDLVPSRRTSTATAIRVVDAHPSTEPARAPAAQATAASRPRPAVATAVPAPDPEHDRLRLRQISHDIHHELGTIMLLASLLASAPDVGPDSRQRARLILGETRWLDQLQRAYEETVDHDRPWSPPPEPIRLDLLAEEVVLTMRMSTLVKMRLSTQAILAHADRLTFWRALRNVIDNAVRAAGPQGHVDVMITEEDGWAVAQIDDDGPGFGAIPKGRASLGLGIVQELTAACGGQLEIRMGYLGGCSVRLQVPAASPRTRVDQLAIEPAT